MHKVNCRKVLNIISKALPAIFGVIIIFSNKEGKAQQIFHFDSESELTGNFIQDDPSSMWYQWSTNSGVGDDPGRIDYGTTTGPGPGLNNLLYTRPFSSGEELGLSVFFDYTGVEGARPRNPIFQIGWTDSLEHGLRTEDEYSFISVSLSTGGGVEEVLNGMSKTGFEDFRTENFSESFDISAGLYELKGEWSAAGDDSFDYTVQLYSHGEDGNGEPMLISDFSGVHENETMAGDDSIFAAIRADRGGTYLDNFQVIPEPATGMLMLVGGMGIWIWRRGTRKRGF